MTDKSHLIKTNRLTLRMLDKEDASAQYVGWLNDPLINQYLETRHKPQDIKSCLSFIIKCNSDPYEFLFGIFSTLNNKHIGNCKIGFIDPIHHKAQISLFIGEKSYWSQGLGQEIVLALTDFGFNSLNLHRIEAFCYQDNLASLNTFLKCGYSVDGFLRESINLNNKRTGQFLLGILKMDFLT